jgi:hypothetical protein
MVNLVLGLLLGIGQLSGPGGSLPQILHPDFKAVGVKAGKRTDVTISFTAVQGYSIDRTLPLTLKLSPVSGVTLSKTDFAASSNDPKAKDQYYVQLPTLTVPVVPQKAGTYEIPGKLKYFFCSKADGFCSFQVLDVKIPLTAL